jgi:hypothetical protein
MTRDEMERIEARLMEEVVNRRKLGGYSMEANGILLLSETLLFLVQHIKSQMPVEKKK